MIASPRRLLASPWLVVAVTAFAVAVLGFFGERILENNGLGFDGIVYARLASISPFEVCHGIDDYFLQRVVPPFLVHAGLAALGASLTIANIERAFLVYQCLLIVAGVVCLLAAARRLGFGAGDRWLLLLVAVMNFGLAKQAFYDPVLTDVSGFALGCGMLYAWLAHRFVLLLALTLIGSFAWPAVFIGGALLLSFPRVAAEEAAALRHRLMWPVVLVVVGTYLGLFYKLYAVDGVVDFNQLYRVFQRQTQFIQTWQAGVWLSVTAAAMVLGLLVHSAGVSLGVLRAELARVSRRGVVAAAAVILVRWAVLWGCATSTGARRHIFLLNGMVLLSAARPLLFVTAFAAFYGLAGVLLVVFWREFREVLRGESLGLRLWILFGLLLNFDCEARKSINSFPALSLFLVEAVRRLGGVRTPGSWVSVIAVAFVCSKVWLTINVGPMTGRLAEFPDQYFFMNFGPWMSDISYVVQSAVLAISVVLLWWHLKVAPRRARS